MAQLVLSTRVNERTGVAIGDVVSIHDDDVGLTGIGYSMYKIVKIEGMTAKEVLGKLTSLVPEIRTAYRTKAAADTWGLDEPEEKWVWKDGETWRDLAVQPKFQINLAGLGDTDEADLKDAEASIASKAVTLELCAKVNLKELAVNKETVEDLNATVEAVKE